MQARSFYESLTGLAGAITISLEASKALTGRAIIVDTEKLLQLLNIALSNSTKVLCTCSATDLSTPP